MRSRDHADHIWHHSQIYSKTVIIHWQERIFFVSICCAHYTQCHFSMLLTVSMLSVCSLSFSLIPSFDLSSFSSHSLHFQPIYIDLTFRHFTTIFFGNSWQLRHVPVSSTFHCFLSPFQYPSTRLKSFQPFSLQKHNFRTSAHPSSALLCSRELLFSLTAFSFINSNIRTDFLDNFVMMKPA